MRTITDNVRFRSRVHGQCWLVWGVSTRAGLIVPSIGLGLELVKVYDDQTIKGAVAAGRIEIGPLEELPEFRWRRAPEFRHFAHGFRISPGGAK